MNIVDQNNPQVIPLWPDPVPGSEDWQYPEEETVVPAGHKVVRNISRPTLTVFLPPKGTGNGTAVIVCPGGAYHFLAYDHEGIRVARWLNELGIAAFMLKYRVIQTGDDFPACVEQHLRDREAMAELMMPYIPLIAADGMQAIRLVRSNAAEWGISPERVGMMGFSAGGFLTAMLAREYDPASRPDFAAPIYPAPPPPAPVPVDAPPMFLLCAADDQMAVGASLPLFNEWKVAGRPVELHIYSKGGHGFGMDPQGLPSDHWIERFVEWLETV